MLSNSDHQCSACGEPVTEDAEYGGYVHLDQDGGVDRTDRGHYADPVFEGGPL